MTSFENQPPLDGWQVQPGKHCGTICVDLACPTGGEGVNVPANIELGSE